MEAAKKKRAVEKGALTRASKSLQTALAEKKPLGFVKLLLDDVNEAWQKVKRAHEGFLMLVDDPEEDQHEQWITELEGKYNQLRQDYVEYTQEKGADGDTQPSTAPKGGPSLQLKKMDIPKFHGQVREYQRFRDDFKKFVEPVTNTKQRGFALRQALGPEIQKVLGYIEDDVDKMWERLDERYGDRVKLVDAVINGIEKMRDVKEGEHRKLVAYIDAVEQSHYDLKRAGLEREMSNTRVVGEIERHLPPSVFGRWVRHMHDESNGVDRLDRLPELLRFLVKERRSLEYSMEGIRSGTQQSRAVVHAVETTETSSPSPSSCLLHPRADHGTGECRAFLAMPCQERFRLVKESRACFSCLGVGHPVAKCRKKRQCGTQGCTRLHHATLHYQERSPPSNDGGPGAASGTATVSSIHNSVQRKGDKCLLQLMDVPTPRGKLVTVWDSCATSSLVTHAAAKKLKARGIPVKIHMTKVGDVTDTIDSYRYKIPLTDKQGGVVNIEAYGIERITATVSRQDVGHLAELFHGVQPEDIRRPEGDIDLLVGYEYAAYHPVKIQASGHLLLLSNQFGQCLGGSHPAMGGEGRMEVQIHHVKTVGFDEFLTIESMGISCEPKCGGCKCGKCPRGAKDLTLKEERELKMIEDNLSHDGSRWTATYPWVKDPQGLPDNRQVAVATLKSLERRLAKDPEKAKAYDGQIRDMVQRDVARVIPDEELTKYNGPVHYISHHAVEKPESDSTPLRIVFNSSANYKGHVLNEYWAKGPDLVNNLLAVLMRFREDNHALVGDVRKMFHSVAISMLDQHCHRFLWRGMDTTKPPETYCVTAVNFGDRPSATIATVALRKTAEEGAADLPEAAKTILTNVYMDDVLECLPSNREAKQRAADIERLLRPGNFAIKEWTYSGGGRDDTAWVAKDEKVLGISWKPQEDRFTFKDNAYTFGCMPDVLTKRICLSKVNSVYDPLGLLTPVTVRAKILLRELWGAKVELDQALGDATRAGWKRLFDDLGASSGLEFRRCFKPRDAKPAVRPTLVMFSDASQQALGTAAYARYELWDGKFSSQLIASKSRVAPIEITTIVRLELSAAVMSKRLASYILKEMRIEFARVIYLVDSVIVRAMIQKESYGFKTFAATRIGEIQQATDPQDWYWCKGEENVADIITRGKASSEVGFGSVWQDGPEFLAHPVEQWPVSQSCTEGTLPERVKLVMHQDVDEVDTLAARIDVTRFSSRQKLLRVTARILLLYGEKRLKSLGNDLTARDVKEAEDFWVKEAQRPMRRLLNEDQRQFYGMYAKLGPKLHDDGIIVVGARIQEHVHFSYDKREVPLLPFDHPFSKLYAEEVHNRGHSGVQTTVSKVRSRYWIMGVHRMVKSIKHRCVECRRFERKLGEQQMAPLPVQRLQPSPPWTYVGVDLFGPFTTRGEVNKRARGKAYGVIFNCFTTRAVYLDVASGYGTDPFMQVMRRFVSLRGYPKEMYSDSGTQLTAAAKEVSAAGAGQGMTWKFSTPDAPWQNGVTESLIRGVKKSLRHAIGEQVLTFSELQTVLFEVADVVNERPIGRHPTSPEDGGYLSPNMMLLGRSSGKTPDGPWDDDVNPRDRLRFIQSLVNAFWKKWSRDYFPSLIVRQKWHTEKRNLRCGDVVLVQDSNVLRGKWRMGRVVEVYPDAAGHVRNVKLNAANDNGAISGIKRAAQRLVVILPSEEQ